MSTDEELTRRAFAAYFRDRKEPGAPMPSDRSGVQEHDGKLYVTLVNVNGTLAVYRVRNDGMLKGLKRPPREIAPDWYADREGS